MKLDQFSIFAPPFLSWMTGILVRSLVLLALTGTVVFFLRRSSAAMRHLVLTIAVLGLLVLPLLSLFLRPWSVLPLPGISMDRTQAKSSPKLATHTGKAGAMTVRVMPVETRHTTSVASAASPDLPPDYQAAGGSDDKFPVGPSGLLWQPLPTVATLVSLVWLCGVSALLLRTGLGLFRLRRMAQRVARTATIVPIQEEERVALSSCLGLRRSVRLLVAAPEMPRLSPMTWGLWHPVVLLPAESEGWQPARLRSVLLHELAHVQRGDWATDLLARVACALYWFNPLVWLLVRCMRSESERACDDRVLLVGVPPAAYAGHLVEVARSLKGQREPAFASSVALTMAHRSDVGNRVRAILSTQHSRVPATVRVVALALVVASLLLLPLARVRIASAGGQKTSADTAPLRLFGMTFYNDALPLARLLARMKPNARITSDEYRAIAATRFAPGSDRFPNGVIAEGLYVTATQPDGSTASWDRAGNLLSRAPNGWGSGQKAGEIQFQIDRLKLPGTPEWIDKTTFDRLTKAKSIVSEFGVVGSRDTYLRQPNATVYGKGYLNFNESYRWAPRRSTPGQPVPATVDVYLTTSYGPWQTMGESSKNPAGAARVTMPGNGTFLLSPLVTRRGGVEAEVVASVPHRFTAQEPNGRPRWYLRLEPVDAAGHPVGKPRIAQYVQTPDESPGDGQTRILFRFLTSELPFEKVASVRLLARPIQTIYFRNVPTRPTGSLKSSAKRR